MVIMKGLIPLFFAVRVLNDGQIISSSFLSCSWQRAASQRRMERSQRRRHRMQFLPPQPYSVATAHVPRAKLTPTLLLHRTRSGITWCPNCGPSTVNCWILTGMRRKSFESAPTSAFRCKMMVPKDQPSCKQTARRAAQCSLSREYPHGLTPGVP